MAFDYLTSFDRMIEKIRDVCERRAKATFISRFASAKSDVSTLQELRNELTQAQLRFIVSIEDRSCVECKLNGTLQSSTALYMGGSIAKMYNQLEHGECVRLFIPLPY